MVTKTSQYSAWWIGLVPPIHVHHCNRLIRWVVMRHLHIRRVRYLIHTHWVGLLLFFGLFISFGLLLSILFLRRGRGRPNTHHFSMFPSFPYANYYFIWVCIPCYGQRSLPFINFNFIYPCNRIKNENKASKKLIQTIRAHYDQDFKLCLQPTGLTYMVGPSARTSCYLGSNSKFLYW